MRCRGAIDSRVCRQRATLKRWVAAALARDGALTVRFVGAAEGRRLNREFRHRDYPTNVLTFAYERAPVVCADIVLCVPVIRTEARVQRKSFRDHLAHLIVHGTLHAQGYDHGTSVTARTMEAREIRILQALAVKNPY